MKLIIFAVLVAVQFHAASVARADELTTEKRRDIKTFFEVSQLSNSLRQATVSNVRIVLKGIQKSNADITDRMVDIAASEADTFYSEKLPRPGGLLDQMVPVYAEIFSHQEIRELIDFYRGPVGKKMVSTSPAIMQSTTDIMKRWSQSIAPEFEKRVAARLKKEDSAQK